MKIFFVENRYKTSLWEKIGEEYVKLGHEVHFIIQNHKFTPKKSIFETHILPYPYSNKKDVSSENQERYKHIIQSNRGLNYFGIKYSGFIEYYGKLINEIISFHKPDLVFGESTLFHELLVIDSCKEKNILYLHPSSSRYPKKRFAFYKYDTLEPFTGSGETIPVIESEILAESIGKRQSLPDYMNIQIQKISFFNKIIDRLSLTINYFFGEKYNTPSPFNKMKKIYLTKKNIMCWDSLACKIDPSNFNILYPLQMQPEANIDVWGYPYNNQTKIVQWVINHLKEGQRLILKANPKSKYEISNELIEVIKLNPTKLTVLKHSVDMNDIWTDIDLVVTVTGTISIECILDNKPIVMFGWGIQTNQKNCLQIDFESSLQSIINKVISDNFPALNKKEKGQFVNQLLSSSYPGINGDGLSNKYYLTNTQNMKSVLNAYKSILNHVVQDF